MQEREQAVADRESRIRARENVIGEQQVAMTEREQSITLRERALRARAVADAARLERERLMVQMREANERLVIATLHAHELVEEAIAAGALAAESATAEAKRRQRAETLATELLASENALRASERNAQASNRAKDEFLAMLGHELRNPLTPIVLALDLLAMDGADAHEREHALIARQVKQLIRLVDDLLDVSRITRDKVDLRCQPTELAEVVARAVETAAPLIEAKGHALVVHVPVHGLVINGDLHRLTQVVANLLTNAAKYTPSGGSVTVTGERREASVVLRVRDTGIGISATMLPRIFDLFAQEHQVPGRAPGGLGLGLAIVRSLVAMHGGTVTAHSEGLGRGSELVIELPALAPANESAAPVPSPDSAEPIAARKILVIDDNRTAAELTALALTRAGHEVRTAFDGRSAVSVVEHFIPDLVFLDVGLLDMDGYEVAQRLRAQLSPREVRFIALSGYGHPADHQRSRDAGFEAHLVKPVDLATLQRSIEQAPPA
jgi:signal transduction histidine kinase